MKKIETDFNCGFGKLVDLTVFQCSFLLFVINDDVLETRSCDFVIQRYFLKYHSVTVISPGPGSAVGEKGKNRGQIGKMSAKEAVAWGRGKGGTTLFPSSGYLSARFARRFFSPFSPLRSLVVG